MKSAERQYNTEDTKTETPTAANDNLETRTNTTNDDLEIQARTSTELLQSALENPEMIDKLSNTILSNAKLQKRLGLEEQDEIQVQIALGKSIENLKTLSIQLKDIIELVSIILVNPKGLIKPSNLSKTSNVIVFNDVIISKVIDEITSFRSSDNRLVSAAGHIAKLSLKLQPNNSATKLTSHLLRGIGLVTDTEYENMQEAANSIETPNLTLWLVIHTLKENPDLAQSIYETVNTAHSYVKQSKAE